MKKFWITLLALVLCLIPVVGASEVFAAGSAYQVKVYDTLQAGLVLRQEADAASARLTVIPENTPLSIDSTSKGWGHTSYNGYSGWISLRFTMVTGNYEAQKPEYGYITPANYQVYDTFKEGLELRTAPTVNCSTFGAMQEGTVVRAEAIQGSWAYVSAGGRYGWAYTDYLRPYTNPAPSPGSVQVSVYDTGKDGLALKSAPDINASRYLYVPENTVLVLDQIAEGGWGHTAYNGYNGWIALQFTKAVNNVVTQQPAYGWITPQNYIVKGTMNEGLELRCAPTILCSTYGTMYDGTVVSVSAINGDWAYCNVNGRYGWANLTYLAK